MNKTDVCIIGAGPAGIFTALEMLKHNTKQHIVIVEWRSSSQTVWV